MNNNDYITLLSAGVFVAIVEGIFSIILSVKNAKLLKQQAHDSQVFEFKKIQHEKLTKAYDELNTLLPEEKRMTVLTNTLNPSEESIIAFNKATNECGFILFKHYKQYSYLLTSEQRANLDRILQEHDDSVKAGTTDWIISIAKFEEDYFTAMKEQLQNLQNLK